MVSPDKFQISAGKEQMSFPGKGVNTAFGGLTLLLLILNYVVSAPCSNGIQRFSQSKAK